MTLEVAELLKKRGWKRSLAPIPGPVDAHCSIDDAVCFFLQRQLKKQDRKGAQKKNPIKKERPPKSMSDFTKKPRRCQQQQQQQQR